MKNFKKIVRENCKILQESNKTLEDMYNIMFRFPNHVMAEKSSLTGEDEYTCEEIQRSVDKIAAEIQSKLKTTNKYIGLCGENSVEWIILFWAILKSGNHPYLMNLRQPDSFTAHVLGTLEADTVICIHIKKDFECTCLQYEELEFLGEELTLPEEVPFGNKLAITTSGTSLKEKICVYTGENFANQVLNAKEIMEKQPAIINQYKGKVKQLMFLPLYHIFGLAAVYFWFGFAGGTMVFISDYTPRVILSTIKQHEVTHIFAVPLLWHAIEKNILREIASRDEKTQDKFKKAIQLSTKMQSVCPKLGQKVARILLKEVRANLFGDSVQFCISGGSYIQSSTLELMNALGYPLNNGYGMSEIGIVAVELGKNIKDRLKASIGKPFKTIEFKVEENGALLVKSGCSCDHMIVDGESVPMNDWFETGDIVSKAEDGRYYIKGRLSDVILGADGENLNPDFAEKAFVLSFAKNFCVTGNEQKDRLILIVQIAKGLVGLQKKRLLQEIEECNRSLPISYQIKEVFFTYDPIQTEKAIKVSRAYVAKQIAAGEIKLFKDLEYNAEANESDDSEIKAAIRQIFADVIMISAEDIHDDDHFMFDLGGTSLDYFSALSEINEKFNMSIMFEDDQFTYCVNDFERLIREHLEK